MNFKIPLALAIGLVVGGAGTYLFQDQADKASDVVLTMKGVEYALEDLPPAAARAFFDIEKESWNRKNQILSSAAGEVYIQQKAEASGRKRQEVLIEELGLKQPTDDEINAFYEQNKARISAPLDQVREQIRSYLMGLGLQAKRTELTERLQTEQGLQILLAKPEAPLTVIDTKGYPVKGNPSAKVTLVKFADYQCPHCAVAAKTLDGLMEEFGDQVKMVYMDFPISSSGISRDIALGAVCADEQGQFWEYNQMAFEQQSSLTEESKVTLAQAVGLDMEAYNECLATERPGERVARAEEEAERLGLTGTPAFFVNGQSIQPANLREGLVDAVREAAGIE